MSPAETSPATATRPVAASPEPSGTRAWAAMLLATTIAVPLVYVAITHHVWEDFLITFRHSKNLVEGKGLVFNPGRRVQGFTSAINVMVPAIAYALSGRSYDVALNAYRALCLAAYVSAGALILRLMLRAPVADRWAPAVFILLYATDAKTVAYTMNGQESALMVAFLALGLAAAYWGAGRWWWVAGLSWAGLLYTRPDAPMYIAALGATALAFRAEEARDVRRGLVRAAALAAVLYLPWFLWAWSYYGQPIPNTALAKSNLSAKDLANPAGLLQSVLGVYPTIAGRAFEPIYASFGGWPRPWLDPYVVTCSILSTIYWLVPSGDRLGRMASLMFTLSTLYLSLIAVGSYSSYACPWYLPSATVFGTIVLARSIVEVARRIPWPPRVAVPIARVVQVLIVAGSTWLLVAQTVEIRIQQREIEDNHRRPLGLWLHDAVGPDETIYLEPIGYIGYYSDRFLLDWPGLVTPEIVRLRKEKGAGQATIIPELMPDWLVLRPVEAAAAFQIPRVRDGYTMARVFDARPRLAKYPYIPGRSYLNTDAVLMVFRRNHGS